MNLPPRGEGDGEAEMASIGGPPAAQINMSNEEIINAIMQMGINRQTAQLAVQQTGAVSVEAAVSWVFENSETFSDARMEEGVYQEYKMVFVVNTSLPMGLGKVAAQVGHAAVDLYAKLISKQEEHGPALLQWNENGSKKIALRGDTTEQLVELGNKADSLELPNTTIQDAGLTEIPSGSKTVLAIFGTSKKVDEVTGRLKLL